MFYIKLCIKYTIFLYLIEHNLVNITLNYSNSELFYKYVKNKKYYVNYIIKIIYKIMFAILYNKI